MCTTGYFGYFAMAIPGGSILKMLMEESDFFAKFDIMTQLWTTQTVMAYVNHKCVAMDDEKYATHSNARLLFLE
jgi:hypothetical protein